MNWLRVWMMVVGTVTVITCARTIYLGQYAAAVLAAGLVAIVAYVFKRAK